MLRTLILSLTCHSALATAPVLAGDSVSDPVHGLGDHHHAFDMDSGLIDGDTDAFTTVPLGLIEIEGVDWIQVHVAAHDLGTTSFLTVTSLSDGSSVVLDAQKLEQLSGVVPPLNGDALELVLTVAPQDRGIFAKLESAIGGEWAPCPFCLGGGAGEEEDRTLCGEDDRVPSTDERVARVVFNLGGTTLPGCTAWLISSGVVLTAGHCVDWDPDLGGPNLPNGVVDSAFLSGWIEFNVPPSFPGGTPRLADPQDRYAIGQVLAFHFDGEGQGLGKDWAIFTIERNALTGGVAHLERDYFRVTQELPGGSADIHITGFGSDDTPPGVTGGENGDAYTNQTSTGPFLSEDNSGPDVWLSYRTDTQGGNSGGPIIREDLNLTVGIHTNGGCDDLVNLGNYGTSFNHQPLATAIDAIDGTTTRFVDVNMPVLATEDGSVFRPFDRILEAVAGLPSGGVIRIVQGDYTAAEGHAFTLGADGRAMTLMAPVGTARIGD